MSLINQMLRDLDRRQDRAEGSGAVPPAYRMAKLPRRSPWPILAFVASIPLAGLVGWLAWEQFVTGAPVAAPARVASVPAITPSPKPAPAAVSAKSPAPAKPAKHATSSARHPARAPVPEAEPAHRQVAASEAPPQSLPETNETETASPPAEDAGAPGSVRKSPRPVTPMQRAEEHYRRAYTLLTQGREAQGEAALRKALVVAPGHEKARELLALVLIRGGRLVETGELLREGLRRNPGNLKLVRIYAEVLDRQQHTPAAVRLLEQYRPATIGRDPAYFALLAAYYRKEGRHTDAARLYRQLTRLRPDNGVWWIGLGLSLESLNQPQAATEAYRKARDTGSLNAALRRFVAGKLQPVEDIP